MVCVTAGDWFCLCWGFLKNICLAWIQNHISRKTTSSFLNMRVNTFLSSTRTYQAALCLHCLQQHWIPNRNWLYLWLHIQGLVYPNNKEKQQDFSPLVVSFFTCSFFILCVGLQKPVSEISASTPIQWSNVMLYCVCCVSVQTHPLVHLFVLHCVHYLCMYFLV